jgi:hypothetical protein
MVYYLYLRIFLIKLIYGKYSWEYISFFKENNLRPDVKSCLKDHYLSHFLPFSSKVENPLVFNTKEKIVFSKMPFNTRFKDSEIKKMEPDTYSVYMAGNDLISVYGYLSSAFGKRNKEFYFFLNQHFVMGEFVFAEVQNRNIEPIFAKLFEKYKLTNIEARDNFYIRDPFGSTMYIVNDGFSLVFTYFNPNTPENREIMEKWFEYKPIVMLEEGEEFTPEL